MEEQRLKEELNNSFERILSRRQNGYKVVSVLLISWEDSDEAEISEEVKSLASVFTDAFGFTVSKYLIPSDRPEPSLQKKLSDVIYKLHEAQESLLVVYYAGHGDANPEERKAIWAAKSKGGPVLNWYKVQQCVLNFEGDVLLILDCCYALLAARDHGSRVHELLAASSLHDKTPPAGKYSFTSRLVQTISRMLREKVSITVEAIYSRLILLDKEEKLYATPTRLLLQGAGETIQLRPIQGQRKPGPEIALIDQPLALLSLNIFFSKQFDDKTMRALQRWLKTHVPNDISTVTVDKIILRTEQIQSFLSGRVSLQRAISNDLESTNQAEPMLIQPFSDNASDFFTSRAAEGAQARMTFERLQEMGDHVYRSLESNLMLNPSFNSESTMKRLQEDGSAQQLGLSDAAKLRLLTMELEEDEGYSNESFSLPVDYIEYEALDNQRYAYERDGNNIVYIEYHDYGSPDGSKHEALKRVTKLSKLLKLAPKTIISTLPYDGYIDNPADERFELIFRTPIKQLRNKDPFISLEEAYTAEKYVALDDRCRIALSLAKTLASFHAVGWVHKSLRPENIIFLYDDSCSRYNLFEPFILGFDLSRSKREITRLTKEYRRARQIYTHPKRWGRPRGAFSPIHDIYSLGVILLEIGCWRQASKFDQAKRGFVDVNDEQVVLERLIQVANTHLLQMTGKKYSTTVLSCLEGTFAVEAMNTEDHSQLHKAFTSQILDVLERVKSGL